MEERNLSLIGLDEVGRGCLAGPLVAAGTFFGGKREELEEVLRKLEAIGIGDSKKISALKRKKILEELGIEDSLIPNGLLSLTSLSSPRSSFNLSLSMSEVSPHIIDRVNILEASLMAMKNCAVALAQNFAQRKKCRGIFDGNKIPQELPSFIEGEFLIKGDSRSALIGLSSLVAKEYRDRLMKNCAITYPNYGFEKNVGYPTSEHREALRLFGPTPLHRRTFKGVRENL